MQPALTTTRQSLRTLFNKVDTTNIKRCLHNSTQMRAVAGAGLFTFDTLILVCVLMISIGAWCWLYY